MGDGLDGWDPEYVDWVRGQNRRFMSEHDEQIKRTLQEILEKVRMLHALQEPTSDRPTFRWWYSTTDLDPLIEGINDSLALIQEKLDQIMATQADLDQALADYETAEAAAIAEVNTAVAALVAKVGPGVDLTAEVGRIKAAQATLATAADAVATTAGTLPIPNPPTPPPGPAGRR